MITCSNINRFSLKWRGVCLLLSLMFVGTIFAESVKIGDLYYNLDSPNKTAGVVAAPAADKYQFESLTVPETVNADDGEAYTVTEIAAGAFKGCTSLKELVIKGNVQTIGANALQGCTALTLLRIEESDNPLTLGGYIFEDKLDKTKYADLVAYISRSLEGSLLNKYLINTPITDCHISNIGTLKSNYFGNSINLKSITIGSGITTIDTSAFVKCTNLKDVEISEGVETIGNAFDDCSALETIKLPSTLKTMGYLLDSPLLKDMYVYAINPPTLNAKFGIYPQKPTVACTVHVPYESVEAYKSAAGWSDLPTGYVIAGDLGVDSSTTISFDAADGGSLAVVAFDGEPVDFTAVTSGSQTFEQKASTVTVAAVPDAGQEVTSLVFTDRDNNPLSIASFRVRGGWLEATLPLQDFTAKAEFAPATARTLTVAAPTADGEDVQAGQLKLALPKGAAYKFEYQPTPGYKVETMQLGSEPLEFATSDNGAANVEIPDYDGEQTLHIVEAKDIQTSVAEVNNNRPILRFDGSAWQFSNLTPDTEISVFNLDGTKVYNAKATSCIDALPASLKGIHIVHAAGTAYKIAF